LLTIFENLASTVDNLNKTTSRINTMLSISMLYFMVAQQNAGL
jgi:hypothetical protein